MVDHINGIKLDNRIENLREVTQRENGCNRYMHRLGKLPGVEKNTKGSGFYCRIRICGKRVYLGLYPTQEEAYEVYLLAKSLVT
jgi:hypothetical protein